VPLLPLPGYLRSELGGLRFVRRHVGDTLAPEADVGPGGLPQGRGKRFAVLPRGEAQLEQRIVLVGLQLWCQHAGGRPPRLAAVALGIQQRHAPARQGQLPGTRGADGAGTHHDNIVASRHLYSL
jgi:hypothetical protein